MSATILILAPESAALELSSALRADLHAQIFTATQQREALAFLRRHECTLVLIDENLAYNDPAAADLLYQSAGTAMVLEVNFAISGTPRILRQVRAALLRRTHDQERARLAVLALLQNELNDALAGLLLESQLALRNASPATEPKLRNLVHLADNLRERLRVA
jgi:CheY-like chemotaxis protein